MPFITKDQKVQMMLAYLGYAVGTIDGIWGRNTANALMSFQGYFGLPQTGKYDTRTFDTLHEKFMEYNYTAAGALLQLLLWYAGYDPGTIDGVVGRNTKNALMDFQSDMGLSRTAVVDSDTIWYLKNSLFQEGC